MKKTITSVATSAIDTLRRLPLSLAHLLGIAPARTVEDQPGQPQNVAESPSSALPEFPKPAPRPLPAPAPAPIPAAPRKASIDGARGVRAAPSSDDDDSHLHDAALWPAIQRERARCAAIVMSVAGLKQPALAYSLAFDTRLRRSEALALLEQLASPSGEFAHHLAAAQRQFRRAGFGNVRDQTRH